jgi:hypothetical protein
MRKLQLRQHLLQLVLILSALALPGMIAAPARASPCTYPFRGQRALP